MARKTLTTIIIIAVVVLGFAAGFVWGKKQGRTEGEELYRYLVDRAYPKPPADMRSLSGTVKGIFGATIDLEVGDPDDYLPHPDGTSQRKEVRFANVTSATQFTLEDKTRRDATGSPIITQIRLSDLKVGDVITVKSDRNIRDAEKFDVTAVELVRY